MQLADERQFFGASTVKLVQHSLHTGISQLMVTALACAVSPDLQRRWVQLEAPFDFHAISGRDWQLFSAVLSQIECRIVCAITLLALAAVS